MKEVDALMVCYSQKCRGALQEFVEAWKVNGFIVKPERRSAATMKYHCYECKEIVAPPNCLVDESMTLQKAVLGYDYDENI